MEERVQESETLERIDKLVLMDTKNGWYRLQLGAAVSRIKAEQGLKSDVAVYERIQKKCHYSLSRLRHLKLAAKVAEILEGELDIFADTPNPERLLTSDLTATPLATYLKGEKAEQNEEAVTAVVRAAYELAKADGREELIDKDVKAALKDSPLPQSQKAPKPPRIDDKELKAIMAKLTLIINAARLSETPLAEEESTHLTSSGVQVMRMLKKWRCLLSSAEREAKAKIEKAKNKVAQIKINRIPLTPWVKACTKKAGLNYAFEKLCNLIGSPKAGEKFKMLVGRKMLTLNYDNFCDYCHELDNRSLLGDENMVVMPEMCQHGVRLEESTYDPIHICGSLAYAGLALAVSNVCIINEIDVPELQIEEGWAVYLDGDVWKIRRPWPKKAKDAVEEISHESEVKEEVSHRDVTRTIPRAEARGCRETTRRSRVQPM